MPFPVHRPRRLRRTPELRALVRETRLSPDQLVLPLFVRPGRKVRKPISSMPGHFQWSADLLGRQVKEARALGIRGVILFGIPAVKDAEGSGAWAEDGIVQQALKAAKDACPDVAAIADLCLCAYTDHGHCGPVARAGGRVEVDNDRALELLGRTAVSQARAGADVVAPSGMMDGMVGAVRAALDGEGFAQTPILSYAAKYASAFYGPFREAAESPPRFGDRSGYQMDPANAREALKEVALDVAEGADALMVKPALPYLDVIRAVRERHDLPVAAYNVSGEFAMVKAAAARGWLDERRAALEVLTSIRRAGADLIVTYWAADAARWLAARAQ
jgi:porphobilinogen synthase